MLSPRYPSSSSTCDSVEDNRFSTSAFCHEPFHPITLLPVAVSIDIEAALLQHVHFVLMCLGEGEQRPALDNLREDAVEHFHLIIPEFELKQSSQPFGFNF